MDKKEEEKLISEKLAKEDLDTEEKIDLDDLPV